MPECSLVPNSYSLFPSTIVQDYLLHIIIIIMVLYVNALLREAGQVIDVDRHQVCV